jgi:hypothetical protein
MINNLSFVYGPQDFDPLNEESFLWVENQSYPDAFLDSQSSEAEPESPSQSFRSTTTAEQSDVSPPPQSVSTSFVLKQEPNLMTPSKVKQPKRNKIKKGEGSDARPDPAGRDKYDFQKGYFFRKLKPLVHKQHSKVVTSLCKLVEGQRPPGLSEVNRWVMRRMPCAYGWLDENRGSISEELFNNCIVKMVEQGVL